MTGGAMPANPAHTSSFKESDLLEVNAIATKNPQKNAPVVEAKAALIMDASSGEVLYKKNASTRLPMASLTKIMTALIILESHDLDEVVTIEENYSLRSSDELGVRIWLRQYEKLTVEDLLEALLLPSAGDAALALATYHSGSEEAFVEEMNERAKVLNLKNTHFVNPIGIDAEGHYSTAMDMAILTKNALRFRDFRRIVQMKVAEIKSTDGRISHSFDNTDYLLNSYLDIRGIKTGTTDGAGECLINLAYNEEGHSVISVLLDSPNRFQENKSLIDWAFRSYEW